MVKDDSLEKMLVLARSGKIIKCKYKSVNHNLNFNELCKILYQMHEYMNFTFVDLYQIFRIANICKMIDYYERLLKLQEHLSLHHQTILVHSYAHKI